jgi:hypothetical protein
MVQRASFMSGELPAFEESERKKGEALHQQQLNKKDGIIAELKAKLETYSPPQIGILQFLIILYHTSFRLSLS